MKRLVLLATILAFVLGMASMASAATMKASGEWALEFLFSDNFDMGSGNNFSDSNGDFNVYQRARTQFDFIANENLKGVLATEIGATRWGDPNGFHFHDHNAGIVVRRAYLDFMVPDTKIAVRGGLQGAALPSSFGGGNIVLDDELTALVASTPITDQVSVLAGYGRLYDYDDDPVNNVSALSGVNNHSFDAAILAVPVAFDGVKFAPYFVYGYAGATAINGINQDTFSANNVLAGLIGPGYSNIGGRNAYWVGTNFEMTYFDPIKVMADMIYGNVSSSQGGDENERSGWMMDLAVDYTGFDFMTPELFFTYVSGEDGDWSNGSERMPVLSSRNYAPGSFFFGNDTLLSGSKGFFNDKIGYWALGLNLKDISFLEKLSHTVTVMYAKGTNDESLAGVSGSILCNYGQTLTEKDNIWEFDLNNKYMLYDELALTLDLGCIANGYDKDIWNGVDRSNAYKVSTGLLYQF